MTGQTKVLIGLSSFKGELYPGKKTGVYLAEALHPFQVFHANNCSVDFASENGEFGWDETSVTDDVLGADKDYFQNNKEFNDALKAVKKASEVNPKDYDIVYFAGGHGCCFDFPTAKGLQKIAADIYEANGVVAAVCHGPIIFDNLKENNGKLLIEGKSITGFTDEGEVAIQADQLMKEQGLSTVSQVAKRSGAKFLSPVGMWDDYTIGDGRVLTGVNPPSAGSLAKRSLNVLAELKK